MGIETVLMTPDNPAAIHTVKLLKRRWLSKKAFEIKISRPSSFKFKDGQTILLIHKSIKRYYSFMFAPIDPNLALCVQHLPEDQLFFTLASSEIGFQLKLTGPHGYFTIKPSNRMPALIATGTGIAPFVSFARSGLTDFALFHQTTSTDELYYRSYFHETTSKYFPCLLVGPIIASSFPNLFCGQISECIRKNLPPDSHDFYWRFS